MLFARLNGSRLARGNDDDRELRCKLLLSAASKDKKECRFGGSRGSGNGGGVLSESTVRCVVNVSERKSMDGVKEYVGGGSKGIDESSCWRAHPSEDSDEKVGREDRLEDRESMDGLRGPYSLLLLEGMGALAMGEATGAL